jgi:hypothetical protein
MCLLSEDDCERDLDPPQRNRIITLKGKVRFSADAFKEEPTFASTLQVQAPTNRWG